MDKQTKNKIQSFEKMLRNYNVFNNMEIFQTFFELNLECKELKEFVDNQYKKEEYLFDSFFGEEHQRNDDDKYYTEDIFKSVFKTPINLRNKIVKFMNKNNIDVLPYDKNTITLYCDGNSKLNGNSCEPYNILSILRNVKKERLNCKVIFMPPDNMKIFEIVHIDFKKYYFQKKLSYKMKQEEIDEYIKLIDRSYKQEEELNQKELKRMDELRVKEDKQRFGKVQYIYKIKNNEPLIIDKFWILSELSKLLNGLSLSLSSKVRMSISSQKQYKTTYKKQGDGISNFFSLLKEFSKLNVDEDIKEIRKGIENNEEIDDNKLDKVINNVCDFTLTLKNLFFMDMDHYLREKNYKFK